MYQSLQIKKHLQRNFSYNTVGISSISIMIFARQREFNTDLLLCIMCPCEILHFKNDLSQFPILSPAKIDPPLMNITQVNGSSLVILHAPNLPYRDQKGKNEPMENYYVLVYRVFVINNSLQTVSSKIQISLFSSLVHLSNILATKYILSLATLSLFLSSLIFFQFLLTFPFIDKLLALGISLRICVYLYGCLHFFNHSACLNLTFHEYLKISISNLQFHLTTTNICLYGLYIPNFKWFLDHSAIYLCQFCHHILIHKVYILVWWLTEYSFFGVHLRQESLVIRNRRSPFKLVQQDKWKGGEDLYQEITCNLMKSQRQELKCCQALYDWEGKMEKPVLKNSTLSLSGHMLHTYNCLQVYSILAASSNSCKRDCALGQSISCSQGEVMRDLHSHISGGGGSAWEESLKLNYHCNYLINFIKNRASW